MLFVYGTLQDPDILAAVLGRPVDVTALRPASAPGFRAVAYPGRVYPALIAVPGDTAPGRIIGGLGPLDIEVLDAFEGEEYRRQTIGVLVDGSLQQAEAYLPAIAIDAGPAWSLAEWAARHKPAVLGAETGTARALRQRLTSTVPG